MTFEEIVSRFEVKSHYRDRVQAVCPAHPDKQASLTISRGRTGTLLHCHAGCDWESILNAVGLKRAISLIVISHRATVGRDMLNPERNAGLKNIRLR